MKEERRKHIRQRLKLKLPVRAHCRETLDFQWTEVTRLIDVSPFGASISLKRPVERGRLLHLTIPMPRQLRVFDHVEDQYRVWALVRHLKPLLIENDSAPSFEIGVAFVGKRPPKSYEVDPARRYDIAASATEISILEDADEILGSLPLMIDREYTRHNIPVDLVLETFDEAGGIGSSENTVTENIGSRGATIFTSLALSAGRLVRLTSGEYKITVYAVVRLCSTEADGFQRIYVEFIDKEWPL